MIITTQLYLGPAEYLNKTLCYWRKQSANGDLIPGLQSNGSCTPTYEPDTSPNAVLFTRNPTTCKLIDDENTTVVVSNTPFEVGTLLHYDRSIPMTKKKGVAFYGSSSIGVWMAYLQEDFPDYTTIGRGFGGSTLAEGFEEFKRLIYPIEPSVLVIYAGDNDIAGGAKPEAVQSSFRGLMTVARKLYPNLPIAYISIKPSPSRAKLMPQMNDTNNLIREDIATMFTGATFIDVWPLMLLPNGQPNPDLFGPDMLHMNRKGYAIWRKEVTNYLESI